MNEEEYHFLLGERHTLQRLIKETPLESVIDLLSLRGRLADVEEQIAQAEAGPINREPARAHLTFSGRPVIGQHGIVADFGAEAVGGFVEAVAAISASLTGTLAAAGPIPRRDQNQLLITNVALGSFGFELKEHRTEGSTIAEPTTVELALERAANLLQSTLEASDEHLADAASDLGPRTLEYVYQFVNFLEKNEALCTLATREGVFRFEDIAQVRRSKERLSQDNVTGNEQLLEIQFLGALPMGRAFEFQILASEEVLSGRSAPGLPSLAPINEHLYQAARAKFMVTRVRDGKPRYQLLEMPDWQPVEP